MPVRQIIEGGRVPVKVFTDDLDPHARQQLVNVAQLPIAFGHVAAMPDAHAGIGATVLTGWLLGLPSMHSPRRIMYLMGGVIAVATIPSIIMIFTHSLPLAKVMLWIFIPSIYFYIGPCFGVLNNLAPCRMRAQYCAVTLLVANVGNLIIAPQLVGFLSDLFAPGHVANAASLRMAPRTLSTTSGGISVML